MELFFELFAGCCCKELFILVFTILSTCSMQAHGEEFVVTKIKQGLLRGLVEQTLNGKKYSSYYNVPYARPPVGSFRFKDPSPVEPWTGELNATGPDAIQCIQFDFISLLTLGDEDCLILHVHTPQVPPSSKPKGMEVLILIHGGGFTFGSAAAGTSPLYILDKADFVVVAMNYRLDVFGFLSTEDTVIQGNYGLKDQSMAIRWVHENIAYFGGDPNKVTIGGHSAGGASSGYHMLSPLSRGLFRSALLWSGSPFIPSSIATSPKSKATRLATYLNCPTHNHHAMLDCLRRRSAIDLVNASRKFRTFKNNFPLSTFTPCVEKATSNYFINDTVENILTNKQAMDIPLMITWTPMESAFLGAEFLDDGVTSNDLDTNWNDLAPVTMNYVDIYPESLRNKISSEIRKYYLNEKPVVGNAPRVIKMLSDRHFIAAIYKFLHLFTTNYKSPVHSVKFTFRTLLTVAEMFTYGYNDDVIGTGHGDDLLFTSIVIKELNLHKLQPKFKQVSDALLAPIISTTKGEPLDWPTANSETDGVVYLKVDDPSKGKVIEIDPDMGNHKFWETLPPQLFV